jgi:hypothetical protein
VWTTCQGDRPLLAQFCANDPDYLVRVRREGRGGEHGCVGGRQHSAGGRQGGQPCEACVISVALADRHEQMEVVECMGWHRPPTAKQH